MTWRLVPRVLAGALAAVGVVGLSLFEVGESAPDELWSAILSEPARPFVVVSQALRGDRVREGFFWDSIHGVMILKPSGVIALYLVPAAALAFVSRKRNGSGAEPGESAK